MSFSGRCTLFLSLHLWTETTPGVVVRIGSLGTTVRSRVSGYEVQQWVLGSKIRTGSWSHRGFLSRKSVRRHLSLKSGWCYGRPGTQGPRSNWGYLSPKSNRGHLDPKSGWGRSTVEGRGIRDPVGYTCVRGPDGWGTGTVVRSGRRVGWSVGRI